MAAVKMFGKQLPWDTDVDIAESKLDWDRWVNATFELDKYGIWVRRMVVPNAYQPRKYKHVQVGELNIGGIRGDDYPFKEKITHSGVPFFGPMFLMYSLSSLVGRLSTRTILPKIGLTGQFCVFCVGLTGQLENFGRL